MGVCTGINGACFGDWFSGLCFSDRSWLRSSDSALLAHESCLSNPFSSRGCPSGDLSSSTCCQALLMILYTVEVYMYMYTHMHMHTHTHTLTLPSETNL